LSLDDIQTREGLESELSRWRGKAAYLEGSSLQEGGRGTREREEKVAERAKEALPRVLVQ